VGAEEGLLPIEFISRSLKREVRLQCSACGLGYLVQVCTRFGGYTFKYLHVLNEQLTSSCDFGRVGTILPTRAKSCVHQAFPPGRVETCGLGVHTGYLSASNEVEPESRYLEEFFGKLFGFIGRDDIFG